MRSRAGFTLVEALLALALALVLIILLFGIVSYSTRSTARLGSKLAAQQAQRKAVVRFLREVQESMEVVSPRAGSTLGYAVLRDKLALLRWYYLVQQGNAPDMFELRMYRHDDSLPPGQREEVLLQNVRRLAFTTRTEGALQINLVLGEEGAESTVLTTVRLRNIAAAEELW